jgi:uncharacterized protein YqfA (UPF0365 family)
MTDAQLQALLQRAESAGVPIEPEAAEAHMAAGGDLERIVDALVLARDENVPLDFYQATALQVYGRDPLRIVREGARTPEGHIDFAALFPVG